MRGSWADADALAECQRDLVAMERRIVTRILPSAATGEAAQALRAAVQALAALEQWLNPAAR